MLATRTAKRFVARSLDADEASIFNNSFGDEFFLGGSVFRLQNHRPRSAHRRHCDTSIRIGWPVFAIHLALVAWTGAARLGFGQDLCHGPGGICPGTTIAGLWQSTRHRGQFFGSHGCRAVVNGGLCGGVFFGGNLGGGGWGGVSWGGFGGGGCLCGWGG